MFTTSLLDVVVWHVVLGRPFFFKQLPTAAENKAGESSETELSLGCFDLTALSLSSS